MGLDSVELVMRVEKHFDISIPDIQAAQLLTVRQLHMWVVNELSRLGRKVDSTALFYELRDLICDQLGVNADRVVPAASFVQDLRID